MKRVDRLVLGEIFGPWVFGVMIFTVLIMAGSFLFQFTRLLSQGVPFGIVLQLTALLLPGILAKTFSMAMLLGTLLAFGRLSGDSEIVALRAGGVSIPRIMAPVAAFGLLVSLVTYFFTDFVVPGAAIQATAMQKELAEKIEDKTQATAQPLYDEGKLVGYLIARRFSLADRTLSGVSIQIFDKQGQVEALFEVPRLEFESIDKWRAYGGSTLHHLASKSTLKFEEGIWPDGVPEMNIKPEDLLVQGLRDLDSFSSRELKEQAAKMRRNPNAPKKEIVNLEFGYWNKFALPLAALVFGLVGAPLGIRSHRAGNATGFWLSVIIIFGYMLVTNVLSIMAQGGAIPAWVASFGPILVGLVVAVDQIRRKNSQ
ncbi:MAG: LptF/LptG family permease [Armatimonadetes bacterium]|nr:LptF/LptG family permease [Armatimonadota bacterium]